MHHPLLCLLLVPLLGACSDDGFANPDAPGPNPDHPILPDTSLPEAFVEHDITVAPPVTLTLATFNVENFFDEFDDASHSDDVPTAAQVQAKITALGKALRQLKADVLALQEVENKQLLDRLNQQELSALGYAHVRLIEGNDIRGIDVALLSRFPVPKAASHVMDRFVGVDGDTRTYGFSRDCLEVTIDAAAGRQLVLLINHLRATDGTQEAIDRRLAQAQRVRQIVDDRLKNHPDTNLAVVGDLNDTPESKTVKLILDGAPGLTDLLTLIPAAQRYTFKKTQLDYIITAPGLTADLLQGTVKADHSQVYTVASDHYPVVARFELR